MLRYRGEKIIENESLILQKKNQPCQFRKLPKKNNNNKEKMENKKKTCLINEPWQQAAGGV